MSYTPPKVFISATTADLHSVRAAVTEALTSIGCVPVEVASFEPDCATVAGMLRDQIEACQALIHIAGARYGPEPDPATLPPGAPRRSYTQMEYHIGCEVKAQRGDKEFPIYVFVCPENFPYDPAPGIEIAEKWALQEAHRNQLPKSPYFCGSPESAEDMRSWAIGLQEQFPPPPPPPPPPPLPVEAAPAQMDSDLSRTPVSADTPMAPDSPGRSRLPLVLVTLAAMGAVAILAAAWFLQQKGYFGNKLVPQKAPAIKTVPTVPIVRTEPHVSPEPKPSAPVPVPAPAPVVVEPTPQPQPPSTPPTPSTPKPSTPAPVVAKKPTPLPTPPSAPPPQAPPSAPSPPRLSEINLVRSAALAMNPATKVSAADIGKLYVEQPVLNGKTFTRADVVRQVEQFRRTWDTQSYDVIEGPTVTSGEGSNHVTVKVKTRFAGVPKTGIKFSTVITTSEYVVIVGADGTPLIESQRELSQE